MREEAPRFMANFNQPAAERDASAALGFLLLR
jgi:hypothetical protein